MYSLNEITDSNVLYNRNPPRFMNYIILIVTVLVGVTIVWANKNVKTFVVKGQGLVTSQDKTHIMVKAPGEIKEVFVEEGKEVKAGDVLFTSNSTETDLQLQQAKAQINNYTERMELVKRAEENATNGTNDFDPYDSLEVEYYNKLTQAYIDRKEFNVNEDALKEQGYEEGQIDEFAKTQEDKRNAHYYKTISDFTNERKQYELEIEKLQSQVDALAKNKDEYKVIAQNSGIVHLETPLTVGMVLQGGSLVGTITSNKEELIIESMILSIDRPRIHKGDEVQIMVGGLLQSEYGTVPGKVISIDEDATIDKEKGNAYFKVKVKPERGYLVDSKGEKVNLTVGMTTETRVKYEKVTYMKYILEQIGVKFN